MIQKKNLKNIMDHENHRKVSQKISDQNKCLTIQQMMYSKISKIIYYKPINNSSNLTWQILLHIDCYLNSLTLVMFWLLLNLAFLGASQINHIKSPPNIYHFIVFPKFYLIPVVEIEAFLIICLDKKDT